MGWSYQLTRGSTIPGGVNLIVVALWQLSLSGP
jgi:hypothetical protein